jgi:hypothetical protein
MSTLNQRLDRVILRLKVIAKAEVGQYLVFKNNSVSIRDYYMIITPIIRTLATESRDDVTGGLNCLLDDIDRLITDYTKQPELLNASPSDYDRKCASDVSLSLNRLKNELPNVYNASNKGLNAAKETYKEDPVCVATLEGIIDRAKLINRKIHGILGDMQKKFGVTAEASSSASTTTPAPATTTNVDGDLSE